MLIDDEQVIRYGGAQADDGDVSPYHLITDN